MKFVMIKQIRSSIGRSKSHKKCLIGLGIKKIHQEVKIATTPENLGMIKQVSYMLHIEE